MVMRLTAPARNSSKGDHRVTFVDLVLRVVLVGVVGFASLAVQWHGVSSPAVLAEDAKSADQEREQGQAEFRRGAFPNAVLNWYEAARLYEAEGKSREQAQVLNYLGQALYQVGRYKDAGSVLAKSIGLARKINDRSLEAGGLGRIGAVYFLLGQNKQAEESLNDGLKISRELEQSTLTATLLNDLGNVLAAEGRNAAAVGAYTESSILAKGSGNQSLGVTAMINAAKASVQERLYENAKARLDLASAEVQAMEDSHDKAFALLNLGIGYDTFLAGLDPSSSGETANRQTAPGSRGLELRPGAGQELPPPAEESTATQGEQNPEVAQPSPSATESIAFPKDELMRSAAGAFWGAIQVSSKIDDPRTSSYAWGYLGRLYEREQRTEEALDLTRRAILASQKVRAPESLYRWHWQTARLLKAQGKIDDAILAYQRAIQTLQPIRPEMVVGQGRQRSFYQTTRPLYLELTDLLLTQAPTVTDPKQAQALLVEAQDTLESFKAAELQDYFRDECVAQAQTRSTSLVQGVKSTAIVYPVVLPDRLELLVGLANGLKQYAVPVTSKQLTKEVRAFRLALETRTNDLYLTHAKQLYEWVIRPIEGDLLAAGVETLVFVPDGPLRTIPMAALHDGTQFLINRYAVALTPGLQLTDPRPIDRSKVRFFSAGLTEAVQGFPALPNVGKELSAIHGLYGGAQLLNDQFRAQQVERNLKDEPVNVVHLASHGMVQGDVSKSFILTFDDKITMDQLGQLVGLFQYRQSPLELLTLSACETAAGDDRAALGLAGMAVKAGARSALATLWFIDDQATSDLVSEFYSQLRDPSISKAVALQRAQVKMLQDPVRQHPSYWAPFLLINNWL